MFNHVENNETSLSRAHNSSYSDILFSMTDLTPVAIPVNFSNTYFFDLLASGNGFWGTPGVTHSFAKKIRFGVSNRPHDDPQTQTVQIYGFTSINSSRLNYNTGVNLADSVLISIIGTKSSGQDYICFSYSNVGEPPTDGVVLLFKGTVVTTPCLWDFHAHKFITDSNLSVAKGNDVVRSAITKLVLDLKSKYIWNKLYCYYPFVGGSTLSNSLNLKNTSEYNIRFFGNVSFTKNGVRFSGIESSYGNTNFTMSPSMNNLSMGVYTDRIVSSTWPLPVTFTSSNIMGSFTSSGGNRFFSIGVTTPPLSSTTPIVYYSDSHPINQYRHTYLHTGTSINTNPDYGGLWAFSRNGRTFSYLGLQLPTIAATRPYRTRWFEPFESGIINNLKSTFGRKRVFFETSYTFSYFTSSIFIGRISGTSSFPSTLTIKSAFIGFNMTHQDLLYLSEISTKFNKLLNRQ